MKTLLLIIMLALTPGVQFDKTVHDFGRISVKDGEQRCEFTLTNTSGEDVCILAVTTTCGCTKVSWTRETIAPGASGKVSVSYANDEGPYPFDKSLNVYVTGTKKPVVLHIRGTVSK